MFLPSVPSQLRHSLDAGEDQRRGIELLERLERLELLEQDSEDIDHGDIFNFAKLNHYRILTIIDSVGAGC